MTDSQSKKPDRGRRPRRMNEDDPDEVRYLRAQYLSELADWILKHPAPGGVAGPGPGARPDLPGPDQHAPGTLTPVPDENNISPGTAPGAENEE